MSNQNPDKIDLNVNDLIARVPGHIYLKDLKGVYRGANANDTFTCALDGVTKGDNLFGKTDRDFSWKDQADEIQRNDKEVIESGESNIFMEKVKLKNGEMATFCSIKAPLRDKAGKIIGVIGHSTDMTKIKETAGQNTSR
jgi:PAS domain S-box-containing protein